MSQGVTSFVQFSNIFSCDTVLFFHTILCQNSFFHQCYKFNLDLILSSHLNIHYSFFVNKDLELNKRTVDGWYLTADSAHSVNERREVGPGKTEVSPTVLARVELSHWSRSIQILCSDWY